MNMYIYKAYFGLFDLTYLSSWNFISALVTPSVFTRLLQLKGSEVGIVQTL